ncbi:MAG: type IV toxin-antitoxin system AbiEi family antitoxin domain-containing protein [Lentisphaeria bacterium]
MRNQTKAMAFFHQSPGIHRTGEILAAGIYNRTLYRLLNKGVLAKVGYGRYRLANTEPPQHGVYAELAGRIPKGVFCLNSALDFHQIGTQVPYAHWVALPRGAYQPQIREYDVNYCVYSPKTFAEGILKLARDGVEVRVYDPARTVVDCFRHRNKVGLEVAIEALRETLRAKKATIPEIIRYAGIFRMKNVIMPYLEALQ